MAKPMVEIARDLQPLITKWRERTETERRIAEPIETELRRSGLARSALSVIDGGTETPLGDILAAYEALSAAEPAVTWVLWNSALVTLFARFMPTRLKTEVFSNEQGLYCQSIRPMGTASIEADSFRISGHWSLVSGCELADWAFLTCFVERDGVPELDTNDEPEMVFVSLPKGEYEIIDTWHSSGLRGTGSHDVVVDNVSIPEHHTFKFGEIVEANGVTGRLPMMCSIHAMFAAQMLGIAGATLEHVIMLGQTNITPGPMSDLRDRSEAQIGVAVHANALTAARGLLFNRSDDLWDKAKAGQQDFTLEMTEVYGAAMHAIAASKAAIRDMHALGGARALYTSSPLERAHRDMHAMLQHIVAQQMWLNDIGRALFDMDPQFPLYSL